MRNLKIYLDTSAIGYLDEKTSPAQMSEMLALWDEIMKGRYDVVISDVTLNEIYGNKNFEKVEILAQYLSKIKYDMITVSAEVEHIAALIKGKGLLISDKHHNDRLHIGCAIMAQCDILVSLNFKHLVNVTTVHGVREITSLGGYRSIDIVPPVMLIESGDDKNDSK